MLGCSLHHLDRLAQTLWFVGTNPEPTAVPELELHGSPTADIVEPPLRRQVDAPAIPPGLPDRGPGFDLGEAECATDPARPEPEGEPILIDLDRHCAKGEYPEHRERDH